MDKEGWKGELKSLAGPILLPILFCLPELLGLNVFAGFDFTHLILPFQQFARDSLYHGVLPHWNPYLFAGFPQMAEGEGGFFYPGNALMWLPGDQAVLLSWTVVLHLILTGCLMYAFLRSRGGGRITSAWLAVIYQFLPGLLLRAETVGLFEAASWLPGFYWALERAVTEAAEGRRSRWIAWMMFASAQISMMLLAGSSQIAFYSMVGAFFFLAGFAVAGRGAWTRAAWCAATFVLIAAFGALLAAVQLLPTSAIAGLSYRVQQADIGYYRIGTWLNLPRLASLFMFPAVRDAGETLDYVTSIGYIGLLPFVLVAVTLSLHRRYMNPILAPFVMAFFGLALSFGLNFVVNHDLLRFPGFNLFRAQGRMILPVVVALFSLAAVGLDSLYRLQRDVRMLEDSHVDATQSEERRRREIVFGLWGALIAIVILLAWYLLYERFPPSGFEIVGLASFLALGLVSLIGLAGFLRSRNSRRLTGLLIVWLVLHMIVMAAVKAAITMDRGSFNIVRNGLDLDGAILSGDPDRPARLLTATRADLWSPLVERLSTNPLTPGKALPIPALGNELTMGGITVLNAYTPLVTERWHTVAHEYASRGLDNVTEASVRMRTVLALLSADALVAPDSFQGGEGFRTIDVDISGLFPSDWHVLLTPSAVPFVSIPRYVEAWSVIDWEYFRHWIVQSMYVPGEWVCIEAPENVKLPDGMQWGKIRTLIGEIGERLPVWGGMTLDDDAECEILSVQRGRRGLTIRTRGDRPFWIVVRESYMPGWRAEIDGSPATLLPADFLFMSVPVPAGEHVLAMTYTTPGLSAGAWLSGASWVLWLIALVAAIRMRSDGRTRRCAPTDLS